MSADRSGHCLCGAVQVLVRNADHDLHACHCAMCRRWTSLALVTLAVPETDIQITGEAQVRCFASSDWAERCFCAQCGSTLWYRLTSENAPRDYYMAAGLLDDLSGMRLANEIYIDCKPEAWAFAGPTRQMTEAEFIALLPANPEE